MLYPRGHILDFEKYICGQENRGRETLNCIGGVNFALGVVGNPNPPPCINPYHWAKCNRYI